MTEFRAPERTIPVVLRAQAEYRDESIDLNRIYLHNDVYEGSVPLSSVARLETRQVIGKITRLDRMRQPVRSASMSR